MKRLRRFFTPFVGFSAIHWMMGSPGTCAGEPLEPADNGAALSD